MATRFPTEEEKFYYAWGRETLKKNLQIANSILSQLITLNTALLGGSVVLLSPKNLPEMARWVAIMIFLLALIFSFLGILPYERKIDLRMPAQIKIHKIHALNHKLRYIYASASCTGFAFLATIIGLIAKYIYS